MELFPPVCVTLPRPALPIVSLPPTLRRFAPMLIELALLPAPVRSTVTDPTWSVLMSIVTVRATPSVLTMFTMSPVVGTVLTAGGVGPICGHAPVARAICPCSRVRGRRKTGTRLHEGQRYCHRGKPPPAISPERAEVRARAHGRSLLGKSVKRQRCDGTACGEGCAFGCAFRCAFL